MPSLTSTSLKRKGPWTAVEDDLLCRYMEANGIEDCWKNIPNRAGLLRSGKSCRLRWVNYLRPDVKHGSLTAEETDLITRLHKLIGNRWSLIAGRLPGRTDNEIKNFWKCHLRRKHAEDVRESKRTTGNNKRVKSSTNQTDITCEFVTDNNLRSSVANTSAMCNPTLAKDASTTLRRNQICDTCICGADSEQHKIVHGATGLQDLGTAKHSPVQDAGLPLALTNMEEWCHPMNDVTSESVNSILFHDTPGEQTPLNGTAFSPVQVDVDMESCSNLVQTRNRTCDSAPFIRAVSNSESCSFDTEGAFKPTSKLTHTSAHSQTNNPTSQSTTRNPCYSQMGFRENSCNSFQWHMLSSQSSPEVGSLERDNQPHSTQNYPSLICSFCHASESDQEIPIGAICLCSTLDCDREISVDQIENLTWQEMADLVANPEYLQQNLCMQDDVFGDEESEDCGYDASHIASWEEILLFDS